MYQILPLLISLCHSQQNFIYNPDLELPVASSHVGAAIYTDTLYIIANSVLYYKSLLGPFNSTTWSNSTLNINQFNTDYMNYDADWVQVDNRVYLVCPDMSPGSANYGRSFYIFDLDLKRYLTYEEYNFAFPLYNFRPGVTSNGTHIFSIGGYHTSCVYVFPIDKKKDLKKGEWTMESCINMQYSNLQEAGAVIDPSNNYIYLIGGVTGAVDHGMYALNTIYEYNISSQLWKEITVGATNNMEVRDSAQCVLFTEYDNNIYCGPGGYYGETVSGTNVMKYNYTISDFNQGLSYLKLQFPREFAAVVTYYKKDEGRAYLWIIAGIDFQNYTPQTSVEQISFVVEQVRKSEQNVYVV